MPFDVIENAREEGFLNVRGSGVVHPRGERLKLPPRIQTQPQMNRKRNVVRFSFDDTRAMPLLPMTRLCGEK